MQAVDRIVQGGLHLQTSLATHSVYIQAADSIRQLHRTLQHAASMDRDRSPLPNKSPRRGVSPMSPRRQAASPLASQHRPQVTGSAALTPRLPTSAARLQLGVCQSAGMAGA